MKRTADMTTEELHEHLRQLAQAANAQRIPEYLTWKPFNRRLSQAERPYMRKGTTDPTT